jgi:beta-barrel assembly-enhancing protease
MTLQSEPMHRFAWALSLGLCAIAPVIPAAAQISQNSPFLFSKVDLKLLDECKAVDREFEDRGLVFHNGDIERALNEAGTAVAPPGVLENVEWRFRILRDPMVNAFALPNGSVYINSGLLARAENEAQVVAVLAHEVTHVANRHGYLINRAVRRRSVVLNALALAGSIPAPGIAGAAIWIGSTASQVAIVLSVYGYSRELEREADLRGVEQLKRARLDPSQMVRILAVMQTKLEPEPLPIFYNDHPKTVARIEYLKKELGIAGDVPAGNDNAYIERMKPLLLPSIQVDLDSRRFRSAVATAERLVSAQPDDSANLFWLGEAYRSLGPRRPSLTKEELTDSGQRAAYKASRKRTEAEENSHLAGTSEGRAALEENQKRAEDSYRKAAALDTHSGKPYLGLGMLYQEQGKTELALTSYRKNLQLEPDGPDRELVERRIAVLNGKDGRP